MDKRARKGRKQLKVTKYTHKGLRHKDANCANQDYCIFFQDEKRTIAAVADGVSSCVNGEKGAKTACQKAIEFWKQFQPEERKLDVNRIKYYLMDEIDYALSKQSEEDMIPYESLASTLITVYVMNDTGKAILCNLGDGAVGKMCEGEMKILQSPASEKTDRALFTTSKGADMSVDVKHVTFERGDGILLCTDGMLDIYERHKNVFNIAINAHGELSTDELDMIDEADDYSFVFIKM